MNDSQKLLIIGLGKMGGSLLEGLISKKLPNIEISVIEPYLNETNKDLVIKNTNHYSSIDKINSFDFDIVIFAIKPQIVNEVCEQISLLSNGKYFSIISILAGTKIKTFERFFNNYPVIRTMPNLAASEGSSITALYGNIFIDNEFKILTENIFSKIGEYFWIKNEDDIDIITAISGSGPAYYFYLTECLSSIAKEMGLKDIDTNKLAKIVAKGSSDLMSSTSKTANQLKENVTSKGGTTEAAFEILDGSEKTFYNILKSAIKNAVKRSKELSN
jgi:pyrroline-5-carboxylate reductase